MQQTVGAVPSDSSSRRALSRRFTAHMSAFRVLALLLLLSISLLIGCWNVHESGALWPDAPQYANAGAMVRDWLFS
jgi:hypothetical protein